MNFREICPKCNRKDCFGNKDGACVVLTHAYEDNNKCKFYKTKEYYKNAYKKYKTSGPIVKRRLKVVKIVRTNHSLAYV